MGLPTADEWVRAVKAMAGLPDWIAWRLEAFVVYWTDLQDPRIVPWEILRKEER